MAGRCFRLVCSSVAAYSSGAALRVDMPVVPSGCIIRLRATHVYVSMASRTTCVRLKCVDLVQWLAEEVHPMVELFRIQTILVFVRVHPSLGGRLAPAHAGSTFGTSEFIRLSTSSAHTPPPSAPGPMCLLLLSRVYIAVSVHAVVDCALDGVNYPQQFHQAAHIRPCPSTEGVTNARMNSTQPAEIPSEDLSKHQF